MQIFEALELKEFPYMEMKEIYKGDIVGDVINDKSDDKVFLIVDHDEKRIWTYNGLKSAFKLQIYGGILAGMLRTQLKLFYRAFSLNIHSKDSKMFQEVMNKPIGAGRAKPIKKSAFSKPTEGSIVPDLLTHSNIRVNKAIEIMNEIPKPKNFLRKSMIIGGNIYTDEEFTETFVKETKTAIRPLKMGQLNRGFTFFEGYNYATRLIIKDRKIQTIELYVHEKDKDQFPTEQLDVPIIFEESFSNPGNIDKLMDAFQIPDELPDVETEDQNQE